MFLWNAVPLPARAVVKRALSHLPPAVVQGPSYWRLRRFLERAERWSADRIRSWQLERLQRIVAYAWDHVPAYRSLYKAAGVAPADIRSLDDLRRLPLVTKEMIRDDLRAFTARDLSRFRRTYVTTGGSTGIPFGFYYTDTNRWAEKAFMHAGWSRVGFRLGDSATVLRGAWVGSESDFWSEAPFDRHLLLSTYFLNERTYPRYREIIERHPRQHLQAYPSGATLLADLVIGAGDVGRFGWKIILLGSENVYSWQLERIARAFPSARVFAWYGHAEQAVLAPMCEHTRSYHAWPFYGVTEVLGADGASVLPGQSGEIVGTSFWNYGTPFIRYRTADIAVRGADQCAACGRNFPLLDAIEGRLQEIVVTRTGRYISMTMINMHDDTFDALKQFQFYQDRPGRLVLRAVPRRELASADVSSILGRLAPKLGDDMEVSLEVVAEIPRTARGKLRFLDQRLELTYGDR